MSKFIEFGSRDKTTLIRIKDISHVTSKGYDMRYANSCTIYLKSGNQVTVEEDIKNVETKLNGSNVVLEKPIPQKPIFPNDGNF